MLAPLFLPLAGLLAFSAATLIVHPDERSAVAATAPFVLACALTGSLALGAYAYAPLWLQLALVLLLLLGLYRLPVLELARWLLAPLLFLAGTLTPRLALWAAAALLLGTVAAGALFSATLRAKKAAWHERLLVSLRWFAPHVLATTLVLWLLTQAI